MTTPYSIKLEHKPMMLFPEYMSVVKVSLEENDELGPHCDKVFNRWNEVNFRLIEDLENSRVLFKVRYKGTAASFQCYLDLHNVTATEHATWQECTMALAKHLSDIGDPWFLKNWNLFDTKYLKRIRVELGSPDDTNFRTIASTFAKAVPNIGKMVVCPECDMEGPIYSIIMHRNDTHKMSREEIADWLDTLDVDLTVMTEYE